jgi:hypothetical protein
MILLFEFTIRVYIMYSVSCQKSIFDNFGNHISRHHTYFKNINVHIQVFHILHDHIIVKSHIGSERPEPGPYKCMLTLTSKTRFGAMRGCQEQTREGDLGGSPGHGWTGRPKADNILLVRWGVTIMKLL